MFLFELSPNWVAVVIRKQHGDLGGFTIGILNTVIIGLELPEPPSRAGVLGREDAEDQRY